MRTIAFVASLILLPAFAGAQENPAPARALTPAKKFIPIDVAAENAPVSQRGVVVIGDKKPIALRRDEHLKSDAQGLNRDFIPLDRVRSGMMIRVPQTLAAEQGVPAIPAADKTSPLLANAVVPATKPLNELAPESEEIAGNTEGIDPVLALFGGGDGSPATSFADAMRGHGTLSNIAGIIRHAVWPIPLDVRQYVSSGFGARPDPFSGRASFHAGIDIAADEGSPVLATADGTVVKVDQDAGYGKYITLQHADGMLSRYGHLLAQHVREGQQVRAGQTIGAVGKTGRATGAHLDYRVVKNGMKFDPMAVLTQPASVSTHYNAHATDVAANTMMQRGVAVRSGVASNPIKHAPMVIQVR